MLAVWLAVVIFTSTRHEYWRDEVRVLSLARAAHSPLDLLHVIRYEGHPALWYLIVYLGDSMLHSPLVLPIASITIAFAAVTLFLFRSPFPLWLKALFVFGGFPLYEYSVKVRNYGISMLLFFVAASLYRHRSRHWLPLAVALALLANTNVHSMSLACLLMAVWMWDERRDRRLVLAAGIVGLGILLCVLVVTPPHDTVLTRFYSRTPQDLGSAFAGRCCIQGPASAACSRHSCLGRSAMRFSTSPSWACFAGLSSRWQRSPGSSRLACSFAWDLRGITGTRVSTCVSCCPCTGSPPMSATAEPARSGARGSWTSWATVR